MSRVSVHCRRTRLGTSFVRIGGVALTLAVALTSAGCSGSVVATGTSATGTSATGTSATGPSPSAATGTSESPATSAAAPDVLTLRSSEWSYAISGSPHAGLVEIDVSNLGKVSHEVGLVRLKDGVTLDQVKAALREGEAQAQALQADPGTEITSAGIAGPQVNEHVVVPLAAGHYVVTSFLPMAGGTSQVDRGMIGEFTVQPPAAAAPTAPSTTGTVELSDDAITVPAGFADGGTFEVTNVGTTVHDFSVAKLSGATLPDFFGCVAQSFGAGTSIDDCPGTLQGGVTAIQPGGSAYLTVTFGSGEFGYVSTQGDGADFQAGLNGTFSHS